MKGRIFMHHDLQSKILKALSILDEKGTDEQITRAMTIVFEAFRLNHESRSFSVEDLLASAYSR